MLSKSHSADEIVAKLRQADVLLAEGQTGADVACAACDRDELRDELLNGEIFYSLQEAQIVVEQRRRRYNTIRPSLFLFARLSTTGAGGHHAGKRPDRSAAAAAKLTLRVLPSVGAGHAMRSKP